MPLLFPELSMASVVKLPTVPHLPKALAWLPLVVMPAVVLLVGSGWPAWVFMWALAVSVYAGLKWLTYTNCSESERASVYRSLVYLFLWPGMDAKTFLASNKDISPPSRGEWLL